MLGFIIKKVCDMKRLAKFSCLLVFILFYSCNSTQTVEKIITETKTMPLLFTFKSAIKQHGFCADMFMQTSVGYKEIKKLTEGDIIIDCNREEKKIIAIMKHFVNRYIKLVVGDTSICTGCDQLYYKFPGIWIAAQEIKIGDALFNYANESCLVDHVELVHEDELLYCLTVEGHTFCIAPHDLCAHNVEALILGVSSIYLGNITIINPVVATVGVAIAFSAIVHKAYQTYMQQCSDNDQKIVLPPDIIFAERFYYIQRSTALEEIKQEFICIKNGLKNIKFLSSANLISFTCQFLEENGSQNLYKPNQLLKILAKDESLLSDKQKENLRALREFELEHLEQEIIHLQCTLALHVDELIQQIDAVCGEYNKAQEQINDAAMLWNNNRNNITYTIALQAYKANLLQEHLLANFNQKLNELKMVTQYYVSCTNSICIKQSTNIIEILEKLAPVIIEYDQWVTVEKLRIATNINMIEEHFTYRSISVSHLKNGINSEFAKNRSDRNAQAVDETTNKLVSIIAFFGGPNKDPEKDDEPEEDNDNITSKTHKYFERLIKSANEIIKNNNTAAGRAFQKHAIRKGSVFKGEITGNAQKNSEQAMNYIKKILNSSESTFNIRDTRVYGRILDIRLPNGMGARWTANGKIFIGFLENYTIK